MADVLLTLTSTADKASDLGYLLHKHPDRVQSFELPVGTAHVYYPEASDTRCTVALLLEVDPVGLVRNKRFKGDAFSLAQYVNDRPYAASSMLAVALGKVFGTAMKGRCPARPDLEGLALPLTIGIPAVSARGGADLVRRFFSPLGWQVEAQPVPLDPQVPRWGESRYVDVTLTGSMPLAEALTHLYVLLPVLDGAKHYWVSTDEVDKLIRNGGSWLGSHPERDLITRRYLAHRRSYVIDATERLRELDDTAAEDAGARDDAMVADAPSLDAPHAAPRPVPMRVRRTDAVLALLREVGAHRVADVGCGEGNLLSELLADPAFTEVIGVDVSARELERAARRLGLDRMPDSQRARLTLRQSSVTYRDRALEDFDALVLMEVVEHVDLDRIPALEHNVFAHAHPTSVVLTTPNADYNALYEHLPTGMMRHPDHRFEWTRQEFAQWSQRLAEQFGYAVQLRPVGEPDPSLGAPTQLALFTQHTPAERGTT